MMKFLCLGKRVLETMSSADKPDEMSSGPIEALPKATKDLMTDCCLKIDGKKENGYLINAFLFDENALKDISENKTEKVFITNQFKQCLESCLNDSCISCIVIEAREITGHVYPKIKYKISGISRTINSKAGLLLAGIS